MSNLTALIYSSINGAYLWIAVLLAVNHPAHGDDPRTLARARDSRAWQACFWPLWGAWTAYRWCRARFGRRPEHRSSSTRPPDHIRGL